MQVIWWGSKSGRENARSDGHTIAANRNAFFATSDIVSIHVRLKPTTQNLITANDLGCMQKDALFINTSRAGIIEKMRYALRFERRPTRKCSLRCF